MSLDRILDSLKQYIEFEMDEGRLYEPVKAGQTVALLSGAKGSRARVATTGRPAAEPAPRAPLVAAPPAPARTAPANPAERLGTLSAIAARIAACRQCGLHALRTNTVPGQGNPAPAILFVGEGPGADEDLQGLAFVGKAGQLLTKMIAAMGFSREEVFIANVVKCRPPGNRPPEPAEMACCLPFLREQIACLQPRVIVALGSTAVKGLLGADVVGITKLRGQWREFGGIPLMPTYHPAYLLRNPPAKVYVWADLQAVLAHLGLPVPERSRAGGAGAGGV